jgi:hypothetical protein
LVLNELQSNVKLGHFCELLLTRLSQFLSDRWKSWGSWHEHFMVGGVLSLVDAVNGL